MSGSHNWLGRVAFAVFVCAGLVGAQSVSTSSLSIGGYGALGCATPAVDPPTLDGGVAASGQCDYSYDSLTQILTLTVTNTSLVVTGEPNPVISRVFANLPQFAIAGVTLISQTGAGGAVPNFSLAVDTDNTDGNGSIFASCFGKYGILLEASGPGNQGSIANAAADSLPGPSGSMVIGPVVFQLQVVPSSLAATSLIAEAFAHAWSVNNPGSQTSTAVFKFVGGVNGASGFLGSAPTAGGGSPAGWIVGTPAAGQPLTIVQSGTPGWSGCMVAASTPGPITVGGITFPIGPDWFEVFGGLIPPQGFLSLNVIVPSTPPAPEIGSVTFYAIVALASPDQRIISVSERLTIEVDF